MWPENPRRPRFWLLGHNPSPWDPPRKPILREQRLMAKTDWDICPDPHRGAHCPGWTGLMQNPFDLGTGQLFSLYPFPLSHPWVQISLCPAERNVQATRREHKQQDGRQGKRAIVSLPKTELVQPAHPGPPWWGQLQPFWLGRQKEESKEGMPERAKGKADANSPAGASDQREIKMLAHSLLRGGWKVLGKKPGEPPRTTLWGWVPTKCTPPVKGRHCAVFPCIPRISTVAGILWVQGVCYGLNVSFPSKFTCWSLSSQYDGIWR